VTADLAEVRAALALVAQATPGPWRTFGRWPNLAVVSGSDRPRIVASLAPTFDAAFLRRVLAATKHGPGGKGGPGPCDAACVKCEAERMAKAAPAREVAPTHVLVHADGGACHGSRVVDGRCVGCGLAPDMQSTAMWLDADARPRTCAAAAKELTPMSDDTDPDFTFRLDDGARLSARCTRCEYIVDEAKNIGNNWPIAKFGEAHDGRKPIVTTYNVQGSRMRGGAVEDAELVAWLLTHRDELIRLARIADLPEARTRKDLP